MATLLLVEWLFYCQEKGSPVKRVTFELPFAKMGKE